MKELLLRVFILIPWIFLVWLIGEGIQGNVSGLLVVLLVILLIPVALILNVITIVAMKGHVLFTVLRQVQKSKDIGNQKLESTNYSDLPWWDVRKYRR